MTDDRITALFASAADGRAVELDELVPLVYGELRRIARRFLSGRDRVQTLDTTGLVHEAYLKLVVDQDLPARGRAVFFGAVARAMRQVLVEAARRRATVRRGGERPLALSGFDPAAPERASEVLEVDRALDRLAVLYPRQAQVVECRFFVGLSVEETAAALETSPRTVKRDWSLAQAWLHRELFEGGEASPLRRA